MEEAQVFLGMLEVVKADLQAWSPKTPEEKQQVRRLLKRLSEDQREIKNAIKRLRRGEDKAFINPPAFSHVLSAMAILAR